MKIPGWFIYWGMSLYVALKMAMEWLFTCQIQYLSDSTFAMYNIFDSSKEGCDHSHAHKILRANLIIISQNSHSMPSTVNISNSFRTYLSINRQESDTLFYPKKFRITYGGLIGLSDYIIVLSYVHNNTIKFKSVKSPNLNTSEKILSNVSAVLL